MTFTNYLIEIIANTKIISEGIFFFGGKEIAVNFDETQYIHPPHEALRTKLTSIIYEQCYCRKFFGKFSEPEMNLIVDGNFIVALSAANTGIERWEGGWEIEQQLGTSHFLAIKNGQYKMFTSSQFIPTEDRPHRGKSAINVHYPRQHSSPYDAFYFAFGTEGAANEDQSTIVRIYWNIKSDGATILINLITKHLNKFQVPFTFKCLNNPGFYNRSDSAVLYIYKSSFHIVSDLLTRIYPELTSYLKDDVPGFTKEIALGVGLAEDPGTGESFGMSRCKLIASGLMNAWNSSDFTHPSTLKYVEDAFKARNLNVLLPYLNSHSVDCYDTLIKIEDNG